jgi:hypothetical protein
MGIIVFLLNADGEWNAAIRLSFLSTLPAPPGLHNDTAVEMPTTCIVVVIIMLHVKQHVKMK